MRVYFKGYLERHQDSNPRPSNFDSRLRIQPLSLCPSYFSLFKVADLRVNLTAVTKTTLFHHQTDTKRAHPRCLGFPPFLIKKWSIKWKWGVFVETLNTARKILFNSLLSGKTQKEYILKSMDNWMILKLLKNRTQDYFLIRKLQ